MLYIYAYIYVSCDVESYRVLKLFKINLDRTGALRLVHFGNFSGRAQPGSAAGRAGWRSLPKKSVKRSAPVRSRLILKSFKTL